MFSRIMIPIDLGHIDQMDKAIAVTAELAKLHGAEVHVVGVTQSQPSEIARNPAAFGEKLAALASELSEKQGVTFTPHTEMSHDIRLDLDDVLARAATAIGADLIVMASHVPGFADHIFASNAGYIASHSSMSVFVVR
ncbi:MAG: universal stress protein [Rhodobacteraceae bacterium]|nr:universal stress protein [Paracoccaceae bacterium]